MMCNVIAFLDYFNKKELNIYVLNSNQRQVIMVGGGCTKYRTLIPKTKVYILTPMWLSLGNKNTLLYKGDQIFFLFL